MNENYYLLTFRNSITSKTALRDSLDIISLSFDRLKQKKNYSLFLFF